MINLILFLVFIALVGITGAWLAENPGSVVIHWFDYRIDTSFAFLLLAALVVACTLAFALMVIRGVALMPSNLRKNRKLKHYKSGLKELTYGVAALAAADVKTAQIHTRKAEKLLGTTPLTLLLSAQIARSRGDDTATRLLLEQMLEHEETEYLAARSLSDVASKEEHLPKALAMAERAQAVNPKEAAPMIAVISLHLRMKQWQETLHAIKKATRKGQLMRGEIRRYKAMAALGQGEALLDNGRLDAAVTLAHTAVKEAPDFVPGVLFAARTYVANGEQKKAEKLLLRTWKRTPHAQLAEAFRNAISHETKEKQMKLMRKFAALHPEQSASHHAWRCSSCHETAEQWHSHCPSCHAFDTMEWK